MPRSRGSIPPTHSDTPVRPQSRHQSPSRPQSHRPADANMPSRGRFSSTKDEFFEDEVLDHSKGKASGHDMPQIIKETVLIALVTAIGIGILSWVVDKMGLKFFFPEYVEAPLSLHFMSAAFAFFAVFIAVGLFIGLDRVTGISTGLYVSLLLVLILGSGAYVLLTSVSLNSVVYMILFTGLLVSLSYVPGNVKANRYFE